jgi:hypothetical protein
MTATSTSLTAERRYDHVRLGEVVPLEQQRVTRRLGKRVGEAIAKIEPGGVSALAEANEGVASQTSVILGNPHNLYPSVSNESIQHIDAVIASIRVCNKARFDKSRRGHETDFGGIENAGELIRFVLAFENRNHGRRVDDH